MTIPSEQIRAIQRARALLTSLLHPSYRYYGTKWKRIPKALRVEARNVLRHFPAAFEVERAWKP